MSTAVSNIIALNPEPQPESYVETSDAAIFLGISPSTVLRMARAGEIPAHPMGIGLKRRHWRFLRSELDEWMKKHNNAFVHPRRSTQE